MGGVCRTGQPGFEDGRGGESNPVPVPEDLSPREYPAIKVEESNEMAGEKSGFSVGTFFFGMLVMFFLMNNDEDDSALREAVSKVENDLSEVSRVQEDILRMRGNDRFRSALDLLSHSSASTREAGVRDIEDIARRFPKEYHYAARQVLSAHIRERLGSDGSSQDPDLQLAMKALLGLKSEPVPEGAVAPGVENRFNPENEVAGGYDVDFSDLDLRGFDFSGVDVSGVNFARADMRGVELSTSLFSECDFSGANLRVANLGWAVFSDSDLAAVDLSWADLSDASVTRSDLSWSLLYGANLWRAKLQDMDISGTLMLNRFQLASACLHSSVELGMHGVWRLSMPEFCPIQFKMQ